MIIIKYRKIFFLFSAVLIILSLLAFFSWGLKPSIDFTGGSLLEFEYAGDVPSQDILESKINQLNLGQYVLRSTGENGYILKTKIIDESIKTNLISSIQFENSKFVEKRFNTVGPTLGKELGTKATTALIVVVTAIILFIAYAFRHVSKPVSSWKYGIISVVALLHDIIITIGFFALLGRLFGIEIDALFVTAILVILGYSINDTIVVLDRVRENLKKEKESLREERFESIIGKSIDETFTRSINTSFTTTLALFAIYLFGGEVTKYFSLALIVGIISGTYSSIFIAAPLLLVSKGKE